MRDPKEAKAIRIGDVSMKCPLCGFECRLYDAEPDCDGEGSLGCPEPNCGGRVHALASGLRPAEPEERRDEGDQK